MTLILLDVWNAHEAAVPGVEPRAFDNHARLAALLAASPVMLAPMEDVTDIPFRAICREMGADLTFTEFVNVDMLLAGAANVRRKIELGPEEGPTVGIQIYGANPETLAQAAEVAEAAGPLLIDINCGCWVPKIARRGAGSAWLRDVPAMAAMAARIVRSTSLPVTVKTRLGWGDSPPRPDEMARRLEDAGVAAITLHCRTALQGHEGRADWTWAARVRDAVRIPVIVNGGVEKADDVLRAFDETGCAGVMIGRAALNHPWIFREVRQLRRGDLPTFSSVRERLDLCRRHLGECVSARGERRGVLGFRKHLQGYLSGVPDGMELRRALMADETLAGNLELFDAHEDRVRRAPDLP
jgi:nifR3 family TIM-barrel protein